MFEFPENDNEWKEVRIVGVKEDSKGWTIKTNDGDSFHVPSDSPVVPTERMIARFYGKGVGSPVWGLFINGQKVFYRTPEEYKIYFEKEMYGETAQEWLDRWDREESVWSIEMGGLGPGYEQAIQITTAELIRIILDAGYDCNKWANPDDPTDWNRDREKIQDAAFENETLKPLGLSGAQYGAALFLAAKLCIYGPKKLMTDPKIKSRKIQVSRRFP
jgi:hypothetical protein